ncbi:sialate:O-sulfotransferase 2 [Oenanthe melanoleuca]|uniref:sialate:O-sulfotransferase 2 n=1 Tax=Oenanthe melanoleuca TaxID=2939378 RepID=UPI0024C1FD32|nr:sialate:O-sulfotransferase 2 [Oenanthe melanoleuca]XP_056360570.1 sialate:O-sulfotransferase 2 [Oenanthe melanoleuca]XP_056360571.1 sialate:O-sulfotransferase 2 [Oenanthe melanoleuca]
MAKLLLKLQRYFRRKPVRFFTLLALYLAAGSLVFLHSGFSGEPRVAGSPRSPAAAEGPGLQYLGVMQLSRGFKAAATIPAGGRRHGPWFRNTSREPWDRGKPRENSGPRSRALRGRSGREKEEDRARYIGCYEDNTRHRTLRGMSFFDYKKMTVFRCQDNCAERGYLYAGLEFGAECYCGHKIQAPNASENECNMECKGERSNTCGGANRLSVYRLELAQESARRYGSAIFRGCFRRPENVSIALPASQLMLNMSVDKCVDFCTEKEFPLAALAGTTCRCGFPSTLFPLHEREDEQLCAHKCAAEEFESCGSADFLLVYQTQVQDNRCMDRRFLPSRAKQLVALASFPGAGNTWARHLIELATGFYTGSYYFDGSLYNKGFKGERDHWRSGRTICIKTHESGQKEIESFDSAILLIRNPYKALMAEFNRKYGGHIGFAAHAHWKGKEWPEFVANYAPWWATHTLDWLRFGRKVLVVHFEDLKRDLFAQLQRMVALLGVTACQDRLLCVEGQKDGNFKRSGLRKLEYDPYTPEMRKTIGAYIRTVDAALRLRNLSGVPEDYYPR